MLRTLIGTQLESFLSRNPHAAMRASLVARRKRAKKLRQRLQGHAHTHTHGVRQHGAVTLPPAAATALVTRLSKVKVELERHWAAGKLAGVEGAAADVHALLDQEVRAGCCETRQRDRETPARCVPQSLHCVAHGGIAHNGLAGLRFRSEGSSAASTGKGCTRYTNSMFYVT
jgi:hypothetical protein